MDFLDLDTSLKVTKQNVILYSNWLAYNKTNLDAIPQSDRSSFIKDCIGFVDSNPGAIISFIKKSGLADSQLKSSKVSSAIANKVINYNEYCLIHLSKECLFLNNRPEVNILALICKYIINTHSRKIDLKKIRELGLDLNTISGNINGNRRTDYVSTILEGTGLFTYVGNKEDGIMELKEDAEPIITFLDSCNLEECLLSINSAERFDYFSSDKGGILNFLNMPLPEIWKIYFPNLNSSLSFDNSQTANGNSKNATKQPLQQVFYGAPGTGKSNTIKCEVEEKKRIHFRTTFHPDSDYSTFVGCYKPTKEEKGEKTGSLLGKDELVAKLKEYRTLYDETMAQTQFGYDYYEDLRCSTDLADIIKEAGVKTFDTAVRIGMSLAERTTPKTRQSFITYSFVPQAFTKAYCEAWNNYNPEGESEPVFLIIEEINRGNCAQIFGDIFQLLDRKDNGFSDYPIDADEDLKAFLENGVKKDGTQWLTNKEGIRNGQLCLPPNLYIWATMNTSDQSLFPIDSAFKRRWAWKYVKITDGKKGWTIQGADYSCDWWTFIQEINKKIATATSSDDKKLGYYFCKAKNNTTCIDEKLFVSKVIFYLWNDVFKDNDNTIFKVTESNDEPSFDDFFMEDNNGGIVPNSSAVKQFLINVAGEKNVSAVPSDTDETEQTVQLSEQDSATQATE